MTITGTLHETCVHILWHFPEFFLEWEMFETKVVEETKTHIFCSVTFYRKSAAYEIMWINTVQPGRPHYNTAYAPWMLDNWDYKHALRLCNTYCFSSATVVTRTRLSVMLNVQRLSSQPTSHTASLYCLYLYILFKCIYEVYLFIFQLNALNCHFL